MKTILFIWEVGTGLGHVAPLAATARALLKQLGGPESARLVFALKDPFRSRGLFQNLPAKIIPAPSRQDPNAAGMLSASYAQLLASLGFLERSELRLGLAAWDDLFALVEPDLIVADHSPTAVLAARGRIPVMYLGSGYTMPPPDLGEYPSLRKGVQAPVIQPKILETVNDLLVRRSQQPLKRLPQLLKTDARALFALPMLDPYAVYRTEPYLGHYDGLHEPLPPSDEPRVFFYSRSGEPTLEAAAEGLAKSGLPLLVHISGEPCPAGIFLREAGARVFSDPQPLAKLLSASRFVVSPGGAGLASAALATGRPQLLLPIQPESALNGVRVGDLGCGLSLESVTGETVAEAMETLSQVRLFQENAESVAAEIAALGLPESPADEAARQIAGLLQNPS